MVETYTINFRFRGRYIHGYVQAFQDSCLVNITDQEILSDFTGVFTFRLPEKKFVPGFQRNKDVKDLPELVGGIQDQLH